MYDPKFTQKEMYDQYGRSRPSNKKVDPKPSRGSGFSGMGADPAERFGGSKTKGLGSKPFERGSTYDVIPTPPQRDDKPDPPTSIINTVKNKAVELFKSFGGDDPKDTEVDPSKVYRGPMFRGPINIAAMDARIRDAVDYSKAPPLFYTAYGSTYDTVPPVTANKDRVKNAVNAFLKQRGIGGKEYTIKRGDTLSEIAQREGVAIDDLAKINKIENINRILAGETLIIPPPQEMERAKDIVDSVDPDAQFYQSGVPLDQRIFEPELGYDEIPLPSEATVDKKIAGLGTRPEVTVTELAPVMGGYDEAPLKTLGLMSPPRPQPVDAITASTKEKTDFVNTFVERMGSVDEGREDHIDSLGVETLGYGVLPATARSLGYDPDSEEYQDRKKLATAVYSDMYDNARATYPTIFNNVTMNQAQGVLSMYINLGEIPNSVATALSRDDPDFDAAREGLAMNILGSPRNDDGSRKVVDNKVVYTSNKGLSKRRAREYNTLMEGNSDYTPIADVEVRGSRARPTFVWVTEDGTVVHSYTPELNNDEVLYQGLDPSNSMRTVSVE